MTIYLYVKTHRITGLKYFGFTTRNNPYRYKGSEYWCRHIKQHGYNVDTEIIKVFDNIDEASEFSLKFSKDNNIVESGEWANLIEENCKPGACVIGERNGMYGKKQSEETKEKIRQKALQREYYPQTKEWIEKRTANRKGSKNSEETKEKIREARKRQTARVIRNKRNTSGFVGVCWNKQVNKWQARIKIDGKSTHLGLFIDPKEAFAAYLAAKAKYHAFG